MGKSEGGDFALEGKVKQQKLLDPNSLIKTKTWHILSRALDIFDKVRIQ